MLLVGTALLALAAGCGSGDGARTKAGSKKPTGPSVTLTFATADIALADNRGLPEFVRAVKRRSGGKLRIKPKVVTFEDNSSVPTAVRKGQRDLGWSYLNVIAGDSKALAMPVAPFLVDSYDLEKRLFAAGLPALVVDEIGKVGLDGVGLLPGDLVYPWSIDGPLLTQSDWASSKGLASYADVLPLAQQGLEAVGMRSVKVEPAPPGFPIAAGKVSAFGFGALGIQYNVVGTLGFQGTLNAPVYAAIIAIYGNAEKLRRLTPQQRDWLAAGARDAQRAAQRTQADDAPILAKQCEVQEVRLSLAEPSEFDALRERALAVYRAEKDATARRVVELVEKTRDEAGQPAPPEIPEQCRGPVPEQPEPVARSTDPHALDGVYRYTTTAAGYEKDGVDPLTAKDHAGRLTATFRNGKAKIERREKKTTYGQASEPEFYDYRVSGDRVTFLLADGAYPVTLRFTKLADGSLRYKDTDRALYIVRQDYTKHWKRAR
jgi:TRAP-type C4-dicarboxylate transport system substrate-binding protein